MECLSTKILKGNGTGAIVNKEKGLALVKELNDAKTPEEMMDAYQKISDWADEELNESLKEIGYTPEEIVLIRKLHPVQIYGASMDPVGFKKYLTGAKAYLTSLADDDWKKYDRKLA